MEFIERTNWTVGTLLDHEREMALREYGDALAGHRTLDELMALHVRKIVQTVTHRPGGRVAVHTEVLGRRHGDDVQRWQEYVPMPSGAKDDTHNY